MALTERYITLCRKLAASGYQWQPRPGDWILDKMDESLGMLTTYIERPELLQRVNIHVPYGPQIAELLEGQSCQRLENEKGVFWVNADGQEVYCSTFKAWAEDPELEELEALVHLYLHKPLSSEEA